MDGGRNPNNPARVPPILASIDQPQEGLPRVIHPITITVGRPDPAAAHTGVVNTMSDQYAEDVRIESDMTIQDENGNPFRFKAGDRISAARAAAFPDLAGQISKPIRGAGDARALPGAPENKAEGGAVETRGGNLVRGNEATATASTKDKSAKSDKDK